MILRACWQKDFPHNAHHREISISISSYALKHGDAGLVIVGGRMEMQPHVCFVFLFLWLIRCSIFSVATFVDICAEMSVDQLIKDLFPLFTVRHT